MNKTELIAAIASKTELSKKDAEKALKAFTDVVTEELKKGEKIQLVGKKSSERRADEDRGFQSSQIQSRKSTERYDQREIRMKQIGGLHEKPSDFFIRRNAPCG